MPRLSLQTASLYASNDASWFTGTGGPWGFSPWTSQFGGIVGSAGLAAEPFDDVVYSVAGGDEVVFVIAVENLDTAAAAGIAVRAGLPAGFLLPDDGPNVSVTDGAGQDLAATGDLFGAAGLLLASPLAGHDPTSGRNIALITYSAMAGPGLPGPEATLRATATLLGMADAPAPATTTIVTAAPAPVVTPLHDPAALARGQTLTFEIALPLPQGVLRDLRLETVLPTGPASLSLVAIEVTHIGSGLQFATPLIVGQGSVSFGTVVNAASFGDAATITLQLVVRGEGSASGTASVQTILSAADPDDPGGRWSTNAASSVAVIVPPAPPIIGDVWTAQRATTTMLVHPFGGVTISGGDPLRTGTLAITMQDATPGQFLRPGAGSLDALGRSFTATGTLAELQQAARRLVFEPSAVGTARFTLTLVDGSGGIAQDVAANIVVSPSADTGKDAVHFAPAPGASFLTATADGQQTLAGGETYEGPVSYLSGQYIYDGWEPVAIVAMTPNVFIKNFVGDAAVALLSGQNVVDAGKGSNFLIGGTGSDVFFLDGRSDAVTWDTVVGFGTGDIVTLFGYEAGRSSYTWDERDGAPGYTGRTLRADLKGAGNITASITFAGADRAVTDAYALTTGQIAGIDYMTIFAL